MARVEAEPGGALPSSSPARGKAFSVGADINIWSELSWKLSAPAGSSAGTGPFDRLARCRSAGRRRACTAWRSAAAWSWPSPLTSRVAESGTLLALPEASLGTVPGWGGTQRLPELIGIPRAKQMILTAGRRRRGRRRAVGPRQPGRSGRRGPRRRARAGAGDRRHGAGLGADRQDASSMPATARASARRWRRWPASPPRRPPTSRRGSRRCAPGAGPSSRALKRLPDLAATPSIAKTRRNKELEQSSVSVQTRFALARRARPHQHVGRSGRAIGIAGGPDRSSQAGRRGGAGSWTDGASRINDIARHAGVSALHRVAGAARRARASRPRPATGSRARSARSATPTTAAPPTSGSETSQAIGLIINDICNPFFAELTSAVEKRRPRRASSSISSRSAESPDRQDRVLQSMIEHDVAGMIICPATGTPGRTFDTLHAGGLPICIAVRPYPDPRFDFAGPDNYLAAQMATGHLVGERPSAHRIPRRRADQPLARRPSLRLFQRAAAERHRLRSGPGGGEPALAQERHCRCRAGAAPRRAADGGPVLQRLRRHLRRCTACACKAWSPAADMALIGFDGMPEAEMTYPPLSTVSLHARAIGRNAADLIIRRIGEPAAAPGPPGRAADADHPSIVGSVRRAHRPLAAASFSSAASQCS